MSTEQNNSGAALDAATYAQRLALLDQRLAEALAAERRAGDITARARAEADQMINAANIESARLIMAAETRAATIRNNLGAELTAIIKGAEVR